MSTQPRRIGKFEIQERLGEGAMGEVFLARDTLLGREVAIKTFTAATLSTPEARERFFKEAQSTARLSHPNLITIHEFSEDRGLLFMAMEYVPGDDLARLIAAGELPSPQMLELLAQVCDGLACAHGRGILHRDLKPTNIRIARIGGRLVAKVLDFGIARLTGGDPARSHNRLGTYGYMAPEYLQSGKPDARADLFAVGVILYEALAGARPFGDGPAATVLSRILTEEPPPLDPARLAGISPAIQKVVTRALAKNPVDRYPNAEALAVDLRAARDPQWEPGQNKAESARSALLAFRPPSAGPAPTESTGHPGRNLALGALLVALLGAGGAAGWRLYRHRRQPAPPPPPVVVQPAPAPAPVPVAPPPPPPEPEVAKGITSLEQAEAALPADPQGALAYLEPLVEKEPDNEPALALRIAARYAAGDYRGAARAMAEARAAAHPIWPMALKCPPLRKMLEQERAEPRLPKRKAATPPPGSATPHPGTPNG